MTRMVSVFSTALLFAIYQTGGHLAIAASWSAVNASSIALLGLFQASDTLYATDTGLAHARSMFKAAVVLSQQYNITVAGRYIDMLPAETSGEIIDALSVACRVVSNKTILGIVGPGLSREAQVIAPFGSNIGLPVVSHAATDPELSNRNNYPTFFRTVPSDDSAAVALTQLLQRFNWTACSIIYQNDAFGSGGVNVISDEFRKQGLAVMNLIEFDIASLTIQDDLRALLTSSPSRLVVVWAEAAHTTLILQQALELDVVGPHFTWILSSSFSLASFNRTYYQRLIGMLTLEPATGTIVGARTNTTLLSAACDIWRRNEPESFPGADNVDFYALFAFDATWLLIQALSQLYSTISDDPSLAFSSVNGSSFCFDRRFTHSELLLQTISTSEFLGVSGLVQFTANTTDRANSSYYLVKNVQSTSSGIEFTPVLRYLGVDEWQTYPGANVIVWPGNSFTVPSSLASLRGVTLRIGMIESEPFTNIISTLDASGNTTTKLTGYGPALVELLRQRMGFIPDIQLAPPELAYSQFIQMVANGTYDIIVGDVTISASRRELVDFSNSIFDSSLRIMMRKSVDVDVDFVSHLKPFTRNLWLVLLAACVYAGVLIYFLERSENEVLQIRSVPAALAMSLWFAFGNIVGYGVDFHVHTGPGRVLTAGLYVLSLILVASYTANLASDLTTAKSQNIISGVDDIKNGKIPFSRIGILAGTSMEDYYLREISGGSHNYRSINSIDEFLNDLVTGVTDAGFVDIGYGEYITNNVLCNLTLIGSDFDKSAFGVVMPKGWIYANALDVNVLALREAGTLDDLRNTWYQTSVCSSLEQTTTTAMSVASMAGLFLTFGAITGVALLAFAWRRRVAPINLLARLFKRKRIAHII